MLWHIRISLAGDVKWTRKLALKVYLQSALSPDLDLRPTAIPRLTCWTAVLHLSYRGTKSLWATASYFVVYNSRSWTLQLDVTMRYMALAACVLLFRACVMRYNQLKVLMYTHSRWCCTYAYVTGDLLLSLWSYGVCVQHPRNVSIAVCIGHMCANMCALTHVQL